MNCLRGLVTLFDRCKSNCWVYAKFMCCSSPVDTSMNKSLDVVEIEFALSSDSRRCDLCRETIKRYHNKEEHPKWILLCIECGIVYLETFPETYKKAESVTIL